MSNENNKERITANTFALKLQEFTHRIWYGGSRGYIALLPFSWLFAGLSALRRFLYRRNILRSYRMPVPVIVVGNITAGGSGKTPVTLWLARWMQQAGKNPAIVSRGYGGNHTGITERVSADSDPRVVGDEPVLLAKRSGAPVYVDKNRVLAAQAAVADGANIIISDDGLQHYRLQRDAEIAVVDASRGLGNGHLLPAGPLRESEARLNTVDRILVQCETEDESARYGNRANDRRTTRFMLAGDTLENLADGARLPIAELSGDSVHAVAAIGHPERFFRYLERHGLKVEPHPLADHARITREDLEFDDDFKVIVTEKDAVKCRGIADKRIWSLPVDLVMVDDEHMVWAQALNTRLTDREAAKAI